MAAARRKKSFELSFGALGITILVVGISFLLLISFISGLLVGRNIESYPEKIARGIPSTIREKISGSEETVLVVTETRNDVPLTFYKTLSKEGDDAVGAMPSPRDLPPVRTPPPAGADSPVTAVAPSAPGAYTIQVAAFRDRASAERLRSRLGKINSTARIHESDSPGQGTWFRLRIEGFDTREAAQGEAQRIEAAVRGLSCLILKN
ncbi:MAG: SPOR domain-containing protein [Syntrophales bacterium]|nr:SPOR domain-containing protein [Syntrophales bacterium]MCK9528889.1 SPOR domain-containing protein [Syntrophales bacterium]MDX9922947.1 SPOR domain-containing protein [Syntrophales bacterium]